MQGREARVMATPITATAVSCVHPCTSLLESQVSRPQGPLGQPEKVVTEITAPPPHHLGVLMGGKGSQSLEGRE